MKKYMIMLAALTAVLPGCMDIPHTEEHSDGPVTLNPFTLGSGGVVEIDSSVGDVRILGTDKEEVTVTYTKWLTVQRYAWDRDRDISNYFDDMTVEVAQSNTGSLGIVSKLKDVNGPGVSARIDLMIEVPRMLLLSVENDVGRIIAKDVRGNIEAKTDVGDVSLDLAAPGRRDSCSVIVDVGDVDITLPADASFTVSAATDVGNITASAFPELVVTEDVTEAECRGDVNGGGPRITASVDTGDIAFLAK